MLRSRTPLQFVLCLSLAVAWLVFALSSPARAQSYSRPPATDYDDTSEHYSEFWEQVLTANDEGINALIAHARVLWEAGSQEQRDAAIAELSKALASKPSSIDALYWLGQFQFEDHKWAACADAFTKADAIDPSFNSHEGRVSSNMQDNLAACLLYAGNYEAAIEHYKRLLALRTDSVELNLRLGEALMAVGRLHEATDAFYIAQEQSSRFGARIAYAVALDRAERIAESRTILEREVNRDAELSALRATDRVYAPREDEHYYLGLAYAAQNKSAPALYHFQRYLSLAPDSPWAARARDHLDGLGVPHIAEELYLIGSASWNRDELRSAIAKQEDALQACVRGKSAILARVSISAVVGNESEPSFTQARIEASAESATELLEPAVTCLETAARKILMPNLSGPKGSHLSAQFYVVSHP